LTTNLRRRFLGEDLRRPHGRRRHARPAPHRSIVFNIDGESYRMRSHRAAAEKLRNGVTPKPPTYSVSRHRPRRSTGEFRVIDSGGRSAIAVNFAVRGTDYTGRSQRGKARRWGRVHSLRILRPS